MASVLKTLSALQNQYHIHYMKQPSSIIHLPLLTSSGYSCGIYFFCNLTDFIFPTLHVVGTVIDFHIHISALLVLINMHTHYET